MTMENTRKVLEKCRSLVGEAVEAEMHAIRREDVAYYHDLAISLAETAHDLEEKLSVGRSSEPVHPVRNSQPHPVMPQIAGFPHSLYRGNERAWRKHRQMP